MEDFRLKVFRTVAEKLNFTAAGEALFLTQPAVTIQIRALEEELRVKLFDRSGGKVSLTAAGHILFEYAGRIAELCNEAEKALGASVGEERGKLSIGASTTLAQYVLPRLVGQFLLLHPKVEFSMISANTENIVRALDTNTITLGLVEGPIGRKDFRVDKYVEDKIVLVVGANHEWALNQSDKINLSQLSNMPLIMRERGSGTRHVVENALRKAHLKLSALNIMMELDTTEAIKSVVEANLGVGFVSRFGIKREVELGTLKVIKIANFEIKRQFQFVYPRTPRLEGITETFFRFARRRLPQWTAYIP